MFGWYQDRELGLTSGIRASVARYRPLEHIKSVDFVFRREDLAFLRERVKDSGRTVVFHLLRSRRILDKLGQVNGTSVEIQHIPSRFNGTSGEITLLRSK